MRLHNCGCDTACSGMQGLLDMQAMWVRAAVGCVIAWHWAWQHVTEWISPWSGAKEPLTTYDLRRLLGLLYVRYVCGGRGAVQCVSKHASVQSMGPVGLGQCVLHMILAHLRGCCFQQLFECFNCCKLLCLCLQYILHLCLSFVRFACQSSSN